MNITFHGNINGTLWMGSSGTLETDCLLHERDKPRGRVREMIRTMLRKAGDFQTGTRSADGRICFTIYRNGRVIKRWLELPEEILETQPEKEAA